MLIQVNGESQELGREFSLAELLAELAVPGDRVAIELNEKVIRRAEWPTVRLREHDKIEIVHFVGGGAGQKLYSGTARSLRAASSRAQPQN